MMNDNRYCTKDLLVRLRAVLGHVDRIRDQIDRTLQHNDAQQRRDMRLLLLPKRFPSLEYHDKGTTPIKGGGSIYTVTKLPSLLYHLPTALNT